MLHCILPDQVLWQFLNQSSYPSFAIREYFHNVHLRNTARVLRYSLCIVSRALTYTNQNLYWHLFNKSLTITRIFFQNITWLAFIPGPGRLAPVQFPWKSQGIYSQILKQIMWLRSSAYLAFEEMYGSIQPLIAAISNKPTDKSVMPSCLKRTTETRILKKNWVRKEDMKNHCSIETFFISNCGKEWEMQGSFWH